MVVVGVVAVFQFVVLVVVEQGRMRSGVCAHRASGVSAIFPPPCAGTAAPTELGDRRSLVGAGDLFPESHRVPVHNDRLLDRPWTYAGHPRQDGTRSSTALRPANVPHGEDGLRPICGLLTSS